MNPLDARRRLLGRNVYKRTTEGNPAIAQGSLARRYPGIGMQGWTEQAQYEGKNLFSIDDFDSNNKATIQNGTILFNQSLGTVTYNLNLGPGAYSISFARGGYSDIGIKINEVAVINNGGDNNYTGNFEVSDGDSVVLNFGEGRNPNGEDRIIYDIMLNSGSTALPYEPYTGGQPSPSPEYPQPITSAGKYDDSTRKYEYEVKLTGRNIASLYSWDLIEGNNAKWYIGSGKRVQVYEKDADMELPNNIYLFALNELASEARWIISKGVLINQYQILTGSITLLCMQPATQETAEAILSKYNVMISNGEEKVPYEPYRTPQTVTLTSDRPLTKWDKLEKRNGQWGWVYKSNEVVLDGSEDEDWMLQVDANRKIQFYITLSDALHLYSDPFKKMFYCNTFFTTNAGGAIPNWQVRRGTYNGLAPVFKPSDDIDTVELFRNFLAENQTTILYVTKEETFIPLSESEQEQMNALYTFRPTTVLSNDCGCNMTLTYKTKKSLEVAT